MEMNSFLDTQRFVADKLTHEIFSLLESKFLCGSDLISGKSEIRNQNLFKDLSKSDAGKIRILSIDGACSTDGVLAAKSLVHLESFLCQKSGKPGAQIADFFDVATGSGIGGVLAALLFTKGKEGGPLFKAREALQFILKNKCKLVPSSSKGVFGRVFHFSSMANKVFQRTFQESTLKDTLKPVLIPCYELSTRASFLFSRSGAMENDSYNFKMDEVCTATTADPKSCTFAMSSVDRKTRIVAVDGGLTVNNPTAAAITHVLNNKQEFPFCDGVEDLLVVSLGNGVSNSVSAAMLDKISRDAASDMVGESVSVAFGEFMPSNYVRVQANGVSPTKNSSSMLEMAEEMLRQKSVESVLFRGKKIAEKTNLGKLDCLAAGLIKEHERRKISILPTVMFKNSSPRSSSATISTISSC